MYVVELGKTKFFIFFSLTRKLALIFTSLKNVSSTEVSHTLMSYMLIVTSSININFLEGMSFRQATSIFP